MNLLISRNLVILATVVLLAAIPSLFFYNQYRDTQNLLNNPKEFAKQEVKDLTAKVGKLIDLPKGEEPTIATVTDEKKLKDQPFFANSKNGDKALLYTKAKKAILYRPSTNKVIEVAPINIGESTTPTTKTVKVALYNSTTTTGLTKTVETDLKSKVSDLEVVARGDTKDTYEKTLVVDLTGFNKTVADSIVKAIGGEVGNLPSGETKPTADILVIIGADYLKR
mgnify:CR=1 FL=1